MVAQLRMHRAALVVDLFTNTGRGYALVVQHIVTFSLRSLFVGRFLPWTYSTDQWE